MPKLWMTVVAIIFEIFQKKIFELFLDQSELPNWRYLQKKGRFEIIQVALDFRWNFSSSCVSLASA